MTMELNIATQMEMYTMSMVTNVYAHQNTATLDVVLISNKNVTNP